MELTLEIMLMETYLRIWYNLLFWRTDSIIHLDWQIRNIEHREQKNTDLTISECQ